ncbi:MAG: acyl-CoA thioesterase [Cyclobacteriaceae bacterium]
MARIIIDLPESFSFSTTFHVRISDINYGNHLGNDAVVSLMHEARVRFLASHGFTEVDLAGIGSVMADCVVQYKGEAFYGDELLTEVTATDFTRLGFDLVYRFTRKSDNKLIAIGKTGTVCFDYEKRKVASLPAEVREKLTTL